MAHFLEIQEIRALIQDDWQQVDRLIQQRLHSDVALIRQMSAYIINSGGKRLRPLLALLAARACHYTGQHHCLIAAIIEFIHTATLLHDDVVDDSELRRGQQTANVLWGNEASVLVGDFLYSRAFQMMVEMGNMRVMEILADTTNVIAEGEVLQLLNCHDPDTTVERYMSVIHCKTAQLFEAATHLGAILSEHTHYEIPLADYGRRIGTAFQLIDDVLDYSASSEQMGKNIGDDLAEGKPTLPLIYAMHQGTPTQAALIRRAIQTGGREAIREVTEAVESTGALHYTAHLAALEAQQAKAALAPLPDSPYKEALIGLAEFAVHRTF